MDLELRQRERPVATVRIQNAPERQPGFGRQLRDRSKRALRLGFEFGQRAGINVLPAHFYSSVPDIRSLSSSRSWREPRSMIGVQGAHDLRRQLATLETWLADGPRGPVWARACEENGAAGYGPIEADVLYAFVRAQQPQRIVQIGAGVSTAVILRAARDAGYRPKLTCIDPYPTGYVLARGAAGDLAAIAEPAQDVPLDRLLDVGDGDLLFVDSTHTVKPGSEVNRLVFEVLPRLPGGVWVHFHDITFPYDYSRGLLEDDLFFWAESVLLLAFLTNNDRFAVNIAMSMLHHERADELRALLPHYSPQGNSDGLRVGDGHFPSSLYVRTGGD